MKQPACIDMCVMGWHGSQAIFSQGRSASCPEKSTVACLLPHVVHVGHTHLFV